MFAPKQFYFRILSAATSTNESFLFCFFLEVSDLMAERKETMTDLGETRLILKILQDW